MQRAIQMRNYKNLCPQLENRCLSINPLKTKRRLLYLKTQFLPRSKHFSSQL